MCASRPLLSATGVGIVSALWRHCDVKCGCTTRCRWQAVMQQAATSAGRQALHTAALRTCCLTLFSLALVRLWNVLDAVT